MVNYDEAINFLYTQLPMFQRMGANAYKPGLDTSIALDKAFGNPHLRFPSIHIAGTNGKGSTAHTLAAILQSAGYRVGLYTSPHLVDFRERIRVNGEMISHNAVINFVNRYQSLNLDCKPSFFELTMTMAFEHFANEKVDIAVIETGLGGRLDSTNIITPILSIITNISFDHTAFLGDTLAAIASEKAGIIKRNIPVVVGEASGDVKQTFLDKSTEMNSPIKFADENKAFSSAELTPDGYLYHNTPFGNITGELTGECQQKNTATILSAIEQLRLIGWEITPDAVKQGFANVCKLTGLAGRWMELQQSPRVVCDTGHNVGGWEYLSRQLSQIKGKLHMVIGFVNDKDISHILDMMPRNATYYFTRADIPRALPANEVKTIAEEKGLSGKAYSTVAEAYNNALTNATSDDTIFIGGSTFVVADLLSHLKQ
ncbi:MAG: bifunctional folylpolyglutamate synthase/dihydrofolate synthase [Muribaculaceae bacterium]|nr:bifunctional folylpolyglutamate synthase/dihydrofolate synthase [Muribaculaceae bacterium]